jgi:hypothetical protein
VSSSRHSAGIDSQATRRPNRPDHDPREHDEETPGFHRRERIVPEDRVRERRDQTEQSGVRMEEREVVVNDPELSPETNSALTEELRDVVGADRVKVPADRPRASDGEFPDRQARGFSLDGRGYVWVRNAAIVLTFAAIVALATGNWWLLPLAAGVHALGTMTVAFTIVRVTSEIEHPSPTVSAALSEEGVAAPDERFTQMVEEFSEQPRGGASETLSPGWNERSVSAREDTATSAAEQSTAMTPTAEPSRSGGAGGAPDAIIFATAFSLLALSIVLPITSGGGWLWLLPAVMVPLLVGWVFIEIEMARGKGQRLIAGRKAITMIVLLTAVAVAVFCAVVAIAYTS